MENNPKKVYYFENKHNFPPHKKTLGVRVETNISKNSKAIIMLAVCPGRCLLHHKGIENDQTIFFHVTAGNVKICSESTTKFSSVQFFVRNATSRNTVGLQ